MHFTKLTPFLFAASALASPALIKRDLATIQAAFASISSAVQNLDTAIKGVTADQAPADVISTLTGQSGAVINALNDGTAAVTPTSSLSLVDAIALLQSSQTLVTNVNTTVTDLIAKKSILVADQADGIALQQLQAQKSASQTFIAAVVAKVPTAAQQLANNQAQQVITALNNGIVAFGGSASKLRRAIFS